MRHTTAAIVLLAAALAGSLSRPTEPVTVAPAARPAPLVLTLTDPHGWTPTATLDASQVEAPPVGAALVPLVDDTATAALDLASLAGWMGTLLADGWVVAPAGAGIEPDGTDHGPCMALVGPTTYVVCSDGWSTES